MADEDDPRTLLELHDQGRRLTTEPFLSKIALSRAGADDDAEDNAGDRANDSAGDTGA